MTSIWKTVYIGKLDDTVKEYKNTYNRTIKIKITDVKSGTYTAFGVEDNDEDSTFKVSNHVRKIKIKKFTKYYIKKSLELKFIKEKIKEKRW